MPEIETLIILVAGIAAGVVLLGLLARRAHQARQVPQECQEPPVRRGNPVLPARREPREPPDHP